MQVTIATNPPVTIDTSVLDIVRLVASGAGYVEVDIEPFPDKVTIKATSESLPDAHAVGKTEEAACLAFIHHVAKSLPHPDQTIIDAAFDWILRRVARCATCGEAAFWCMSERSYPGAPRDEMQCDRHKASGARAIPDSDVIRQILAYAKTT